MTPGSLALPLGRDGISEQICCFHTTAVQGLDEPCHAIPKSMVDLLQALSDQTCALEAGAQAQSKVRAATAFPPPRSALDLLSLSMCHPKPSARSHRPPYLSFTFPQPTLTLHGHVTALYTCPHPGTFPGVSLPARQTAGPRQSSPCTPPGTALGKRGGHVPGECFPESPS